MNTIALDNTLYEIEDEQTNSSLAIVSKAEFNQCEDGVNVQQYIENINFDNDYIDYKEVYKKTFVYLSNYIDLKEEEDNFIPSLIKGTSIFLNSIIEKIKSERIAKNRVKLFESYEKQKAQFPEFFENLDVRYYNFRVRYSISQLVNLYPDNISIELTSDKSVFYTLTFKNHVVYYDVFLEDSEDKIEAIFILYSGDKCIANGEGTMVDTFMKLDSLLSSSLR